MDHELRKLNEPNSTATAATDTGGEKEGGSTEQDLHLQHCKQQLALDKPACLQLSGSKSEFGMQC